MPGLPGQRQPVGVGEQQVTQDGHHGAFDCYSKAKSNMIPRVISYLAHNQREGLWMKALSDFVHISHRASLA